MRVANIIEEGRLGGPQVYIMRVARALQGRLKTTVIMPTENSELFQEQCKKFGVSYETFRMSRITKEWKVAVRYLLFFPWEILHLASLFRNGNYDVVYVCGGSWQYKGAIAGKLAARRLLWHLNDTYMPWLIRKIFGFLSPLADGYVYASERSREYYGSLVAKGKPEFVIPSPVDTVKFDPVQQYDGDEDLLTRWHGKTVIGTVANINPIKGLEMLIHAAAELNEQSDNSENVVFVVVGPIYKNQRRYYERLKQLCDHLSVNNINFIGGRADVRPLLQRFDIYVCSSNAESSPISVWEAMAMEKPVVSTDVGDVSLYVRNGHNGFIVDVGDSTALKERLTSLVNNKDMLREFGHKARQVAVRELDIEKCAQRHFNAYLDILRAHETE